MLLPSAKIVAEIGNTHLAQMDRAKLLVRLAAECGASYVKLQKRNPDESTPEHMKQQPHPNSRFAYGNTYLEHRKNLELNIDQHAEIQRYAKSVGIEYASSVWDITSAKEIIQLKPSFIKVPSPCNLNFAMLDILFDDYDGDIHISSGMSTKAEIDRIIDYLRANAHRVVLYHCTSIYPCEFDDLHLFEIKALRDKIPSIMRLGFSNHGKGIAVDIAGYVLGAEWIERHFIDDRTIPHTDAAASLEPGGLSKLIRDLKAVQKACTFKTGSMNDAELEQRNKLKYMG